MRKYVLTQALALRLSETQREKIEDLADRKDISLGEAARMLIDKGLAAI